MHRQTKDQREGRSKKRHRRPNWGRTERRKEKHANIIKTISKASSDLPTCCRRRMFSHRRRFCTKSCPWGSLTSTTSAPPKKDSVMKTKMFGSSYAYCVLDVRGGLKKALSVSHYWAYLELIYKQAPPNTIRSPPPQSSYRHRGPFATRAQRRN